LDSKCKICKGNKKTEKEKKKRKGKIYKWTSGNLRPSKRIKPAAHLPRNPSGTGFILLPRPIGGTHPSGVFFLGPDFSPVMGHRFSSPLFISCLIEATPRP
jgi:hypothetical protein